MKNLIIALRSYLVWTLLLGLIYPVVMTAVSQEAFPHQANGSLIQEKGQIVGSELISQKFQNEKYFWSRPSAVDHNPLPSGGSNLGPSSVALQKKVMEARQADPDIPQDLMFASGSGLDPHITPEAAQYQIARVAQARKLDPQQIEKLVASLVKGRDWGIFGERRISVLELNRALDKAPSGPDKE